LIYLYPWAVSLISAHLTTAGDFEFTLTGPPGAYTVLGSADLVAWSTPGTLTNILGTALFTDSMVKSKLHNLYRGRTEP
jgi:hypothetical protein